ncbi:ABC transporter substrate-binding protein [Tardiphaga sp. 215_C5_N2_1]|jgi:NitT/TauT family transport system substrate-binding protein|uniref:ABC transporter substrate-binding protein n=1 Tax=Tardiphaga sp. 215_C5_N2_1 TaxID=3240774 RepID=UPI003F899E9C
MSGTKRLLRVAAFPLLALFASSVIGSAADAAPKGDGSTIRMMLNPAGTMSFPPFVIKKFKLDEKYGFKFETINYTNANTATAAMQSKSAEMIVYEWLATARIIDGGIPVVGVAPFMTYINTVLEPADSTIKTLADLKGKKLGVHSKTSYDWMIMQAAAKQKYNIDLAKEVTIQEAAAPLLRGASDQGQLDATQMWNSLAADMLASKKYKTLITIRQITEDLGIPTVPYLFFGMRADYVKEHPDNVKAFVAAYQEVYDILMANDQVWEERGAEMKLSPEGIVAFRDQVRRDLVKKFTPDMNAALDKTFDIVFKVAGPEVIGFTKMPPNMLSLDYQ